MTPPPTDARGGPAGPGDGGWTLVALALALGAVAFALVAPAVGARGRQG